MKFAKASLVLLVLQLVIVSTVAAKYLYQRATCPRVWTRAAAYDPEMVMRGRYLNLQLTVDGCGSTLPTAKDALFPRNLNGVPNGNNFSIRSANTVWFLLPHGPAPRATRCASPTPSTSTSPNTQRIPQGSNPARNSGSK